MTSRKELEQHLLTQPFDADARGRYARLLLEAGEPEIALAQFELLCQQSPHNAGAHVGAARSLLALDQHADALTRYMKARALSGFVADDELERLTNEARHTAPPHLHVVSSTERPADVIPIQKAPEESVRFSSIIGMDDLKKTIRLKIIEPFINPGLFQRFRAQAGGGILLYGPPGCGKTMTARAVANECNAAFFSIGISDVLNMWIGESERNLAALFEKARAETPCVLFFDELDALAFSRSKAHSEHTRTVVNEFLAQLDGMGCDNQGVLILAATNMPWDVDPAMKRPGRFSRQIFVPPPDAEARQRMLEVKLTGVPQEDINFAVLAKKTANFSGADMDGLIELAKESALHDALVNKNERPVSQADFEYALAELAPSTLDWLRTAKNLVKYAGDDRSYRDVEAYLKKAKLW
jgi:transitional endoplasmic reticulum ATPase